MSPITTIRLIAPYIVSITFFILVCLAPTNTDTRFNELMMAIWMIVAILGEIEYKLKA